MKTTRLTCWLIAIFSIVAFNQCNEETFQFVIPLTLEAEFVINENDGEWEEVEMLSYADFADVIEDIEEEASLESVVVEGVVLYLENQDPNLQGIEEVDLKIVDVQNDTTIVYENESISITPGTTRKVVTELVKDGVEQAADLIEGYVQGTSFDSFTLVSSGKSIPGGTTLSMTLMVEIKMTINVEEELEVPFFLGND